MRKAIMLTIILVKMVIIKVMRPMMLLIISRMSRKRMIMKNNKERVNDND